MQYGINSTINWIPAEIREEVARPFNALNTLTYSGISDFNEAAWLMDQWRGRGALVMGHPVLYKVTGDVERYPTLDAMLKHLDRYLERFPAATVVDVVNEPFNQPLPPGRLTTLYEAARGRVLRRLNEYGWEQSSNLRTNMRYWADAGYCDVFGLQMHVYKTPWSATANATRLRRIKSGVKDLLTSGIPIHATEISCPSAGNGWTLARQRDHVLAIYQTFADAGGKVISYWDVTDAMKPWNPNSGLLDKNNNPKPVYDALHEWMEANP